MMQGTAQDNRYMKGGCPDRGELVIKGNGNVCQHILFANFVLLWKFFNIL